MSYTNLKNEDPNLPKMTTKDDEIKGITHKREKNYDENISKFFKIDNKFYRNKHKTLNEKKILLIFSEIFWCVLQQ